jgi:hypothetical protein
MVLGAHPPLSQPDRELDRLPAVQPVEHRNPRGTLVGMFLQGVKIVKAWWLRWVGWVGWEWQLVDWLEWVVRRKSLEAGERGKIRASNNRGCSKKQEESENGLKRKNCQSGGCQFAKIWF